MPYPRLKLIFIGMKDVLVPTLYDFTLSDSLDTQALVTKEDAEKLYTFFEGHDLFHWGESHNGCEARADAVCVLLQAWGIPHYKAWVMGGHYLRNHIGGLKQNWNYHVAALLQVKEDNHIMQYVIDPATAQSLQTMEAWAAAVTDYPHSYHFIRLPHWYIFHDKKITATNWHPRNRQNRKWMLQGLAGIIGLSAIGKARLCFNKVRVKNKAAALDKLKSQSPI